MLQVRTHRADDNDMIEYRDDLAIDDVDVWVRVRPTDIAEGVLLGLWAFVASAGLIGLTVFALLRLTHNA